MKIKHTSLQILAAITLLTATHSAFALSCMQPDPAQICHRMQEQKLSPIWANGQLTLKKIVSQEKSPMGGTGRKGASVADYTFTGAVTDTSGSRNVKDAALRITTSCAGPWCASLPQDKKSGYFLLEPNGKSAMKLHIGACTFLPYSVTEQEKNEIEACVQSKQPKMRPVIGLTSIPPRVPPKKPDTLTVKPVKPPVEKSRGGSQIYSQHNKGNKLVK